MQCKTGSPSILPHPVIQSISRGKIDSYYVLLVGPPTILGIWVLVTVERAEAGSVPKGHIQPTGIDVHQIGASETAHYVNLALGDT